MAIVLKITLGDDTRRISFERPPSYEELTQIVKQLFGISVVQLKYEDDDKDKITLTSQIELNEAFSLASRHFNNVLRLFVSQTPVNSMEMNFLMKFLSSMNLGIPANAPAEVVQSPAVQEVLSRLGLSSSAPSSPSPVPRASSPALRAEPATQVEQPSVVHKGVTCDGCKTADITGIRYKCTVCSNYDLCEKCKAKGDEIHPTTHVMTSIGTPINYNMRRGHCWRPMPVIGSIPNSPSGSSRPVATFIRHLNTEDVRAEHGSTVTKTWRVKNDGQTAWPVGTVLIHVGGPSDIPAEKRSVPVPLAAPGEEVDISVELTMPSTGNLFNSFWRLCTADGDRFGRRMKASYFLGKASDPIPIPHPSCARGFFRPYFSQFVNSRNEAFKQLEEKTKAEQAQQEAEAKAKQEAEVKAKEEADAKAKEEAEQQAKEEAERKAKEEAERVKMTPEEANGVNQLTQLGFTGDLLAVLRQNGGDVNAAASFLLDQ